jgi:hypothetical protein
LLAGQAALFPRLGELVTGEPGQGHTSFAVAYRTVTAAGQASQFRLAGPLSSSYYSLLPNDFIVFNFE